MRPLVMLAAIAVAAPALFAAPAVRAAKQAEPRAADSPGLFDVLSKQVAEIYDPSVGGFVDKKGVPSEAAVELALWHAREAKSDAWRERAVETIAWTGGLFDSVGGGYHHSANSADPGEPDFDKRTDSNARRLENLVLAWRTTGDHAYRDEAKRVADFVTRVLIDPQGGFVAGQVGERALIPSVNGIATRAWLEWAAVMRNPHRRDESLDALDRLWEEHWSERDGFMRKDLWSKPVSQLEDQVEMGRAYVLAAHMIGRKKDRDRARAIGDFVLARFTDGDKGGFRVKSELKGKGKISGRRASSEDNARAARFLCELSALTGDERYRHAAGRAWMRFEPENRKPQLETAEWALAVRAAVDPALTAAPKWDKVAVNEDTTPRSKSFGRMRGR